MRNIVLILYAVSVNFAFTVGKNIACKPKGECIIEKDSDENCEELPYTCDSEFVCCRISEMKKSNERNCQCGKANEGRIIGGQEVSPKNKYPWMVGIHDATYNNIPYICGGTLINDRYVLSAAHCFFSGEWQAQNAVNIKVGLADHNDINDDDNVPHVTRLVNIKSYVVHEHYEKLLDVNDNEFAVNDIALIKLEKGLDLSAHKEIRPICLPSNKDIAYDGEKGIIAGWGLNDSFLFPHVLLEVTVPILGDYRCSSLFSNFSEGMVCVGPPEGGKGGCNGDSGGPLFVKEGTSYVQVGIASFALSQKCAQLLEPTVFTRITYYIDWIKESTSDAHYCS